MAKQATLTTVTSTNNNAAVLNTNFNALNTALLNTLSLDGSTPNQMAADIDMNSNDLLNVKSTNTSLLYLGGVLVTSVGSLANWEGAWTTATAYEAYDIVYESTNNAIYRCLEDHTAGVFATDLAANKWEVYIDLDLTQATVNITGGSIAGITDLAIADGGTGASTAAAARTNLGAQLQDDLLDDIAAITPTAGDILYYDGTDIVNLGIGTDGQLLATNTGATAPEWVNETAVIALAVTDETTDLVVQDALIKFRMPFAMTLTEVRASVNTAPTGADLIVDIEESGVTILSTLLTIDAGEFTSTTAVTPAVISDSALADDAEISINIDQIGSVAAGAGLKISLIGELT